MIRKTIFSAAIITLFTVAAFAQTYPGRITVTQEAFYYLGDSVHIEMSITLPDTAVNRRAFVLLTPELKVPDVSMDFPAIMVNGKARSKNYRRLVALERGPVGVGQTIDAGNKEAPRVYGYTATVPYEQWMDSAEFVIREEQCECNGPLVPTSVQMLAQKMEDRNPPPAPIEKTYELNFVASFVVPKPEAVKTRSETGKAYLDFGTGQSTIKPEYKNNAAELSKIGQMILSVKNDPNTTITGMVIDGYASPDGSHTTNLTLSGKRAASLKDYLKIAYDLNEKLFQTTARGEDWATLETMVEESEISHRDQLLLIIRDTKTSPDGREKKLIGLAGGSPYRNMREDIFPKLRRSDYELKYTVVPFTAQKGREVFKSNPSLLSLNEMFLVAESYEPGSTEYNEIFNKAAELFPGSDIANINAAANALAHGNHDSGETYLKKVELRNAAWLNNMGVTLALRGDYDNAAEWFEKARVAGNAEALHNLAQLEQMEK